MSNNSQNISSFRRIPTEEAFGVPEQFDAMRKVVAEASEYNADLYLWNMTLSGNQIHDRLLDLDEERIDIMDKAGLDMQVLSLTSTGVQMLDSDTAAAVAIAANDRLADAIARHPTRYAGLATVPPQNPAAAVAEVERAIDTLNLNGVVINSHTDGEFLSEEKYWPILEAVEDKGVPLYIHPRGPGPLHEAVYRQDQLEHALWGYHAETMGEGISYWLYRIDYMHDMTGKMGFERRQLRRKPSEYFLENFAITTSGVNWNPPLEYNIGVMGADKIMFAVDYPYQETFEAVNWMNEAPLSDADRKLVFAENAVRIFGI